MFLNYDLVYCAPDFEYSVHALSYLASSSAKHDESENESEEETSDCKLLILAYL